jgi:hypothetical protein
MAGLVERAWSRLGKKMAREEFGWATGDGKTDEDMAPLLSTLPNLGGGGGFRKGYCIHQNL